VVLVMVMRVPSSALSSNESGPNQQQQRNQRYRAEDH